MFRRPSKIFIEIPDIRCWPVNVHGEASRGALGMHCDGSDRCALKGNIRFQGKAAVFTEFIIKTNSFFVEQWSDAHIHQMCRRYRLQPHTLPDSCCTGVKDASGFLFPKLLSSWLLKVLGIILNSYHKEVFLIPADCVGDVCLKTALAAGVLLDKCPVDPNVAAVVHRAEMQKDMFAVHFGRDFKLPPVPHDRMKTCVAYARKRALARKRNNDFLIETIVCNGKVPFPIECHPAFPRKIRAWMFSSR